MVQAMAAAAAAATALWAITDSSNLIWHRWKCAEQKKREYETPMNWHNSEVHNEIVYAPSPISLSPSHPLSLSLTLCAIYTPFVLCAFATLTRSCIAVCVLSTSFCSIDRQRHQQKPIPLSTRPAIFIRKVFSKMFLFVWMSYDHTRFSKVTASDAYLPIIVPTTMTATTRTAHTHTVWPNHTKETQFNTHTIPTIDARSLVCRTRTTLTHANTFYRIPIYA